MDGEESTKSTKSKNKSKKISKNARSLLRPLCKVKGRTFCTGKVTTSSFLRGINAKILGEGNWEEINRTNKSKLESTLKIHPDEIYIIIVQIHKSCHDFLESINVLCLCPNQNSCETKDDILNYLYDVSEVPRVYSDYVEVGGFLSLS
jgi:hypothetical protein